MFLLDGGTGEMKTFMSAGLLWKPKCVEFRYKRKGKWLKGVMPLKSEVSEKLPGILQKIQMLEDTKVAEQGMRAEEKTPDIEKIINSAKKKYQNRGGAHGKNKSGQCRGEVGKDRSSRGETRSMVAFHICGYRLQSEYHERQLDDNGERLY